MKRYTLFLSLLSIIAGPASPFVISSHAQADPKTVADLCDEGNKYVAAGKPEDALESFSNAIKMAPEYAKAYVNRGAVLFTMRRYADSIVDFDKAIELQPQNALAFFNRGCVHARVGKPDKAISDFTDAIRFKYSDLHEAHLLRGRVYAETEAYDNAIPDLTECIRLKPNCDVAYMHRGTAYDKLGRLDDAIADYTKAIQHNPNRADTYALRAQAYRAKKEKQKERADWIQADRLGLTEIWLFNDEKVGVLGNNPVCFVQKSCMPASGIVWPASDVTDLLPPVHEHVKSYIPDWKYRTHCMFRQLESTNETVQAVVAPDDQRQCIYWMLLVHVDRASGTFTSAEKTVPLWCDGMIHEYEGRVTLGEEKKTWVFEPVPGNRLVFEVVAQKGYIHKSGTGKVTLPNGKSVVLKNNAPGTVLGRNRATKP